MLKLLFQDGLGDAHLSWIARIRQKPLHYLVILLCLINIALVLVSIGFWIIAAIQKLFIAADFTSFYTGFYLVRVGEGANLYNAAIQSIYQQQFMGGITFEGGVLLFPNPPFVAIIFSPISYLRLDAAFYLWTLLQLALLIWILFRLNQLFSHWDRKERIILVITILAFWPLTYNFLLGQFSLLLLVSFLQMYMALKNSKQIHAGLWMVLLAIKPQTLLIPGMMTLNKKYWRVALTAVIAGILLFIATSLIIGFQTWLGYIQSLKALGSYFGEFGVTPSSEYTLRGVLSIIMGKTQGNLTNIISAIILVVGMLGVWILWMRNTSLSNTKFSLFFAFTVALSVFLNLHLNPHDSLVLVVPAALFYDYLRTGNYPKKVYSLFLLIAPIVFILASFNSFNIFGVIRPPILFIFILLAWMAYYLLAKPPREPVTAPVQ